MQREILDTLRAIKLPKRYKYAVTSKGLTIRYLLSDEEESPATFNGYRTRGDTCSRVVCELLDSRRYILEFRSFTEEYDDIAGAIRAKEYSIANGVLDLTQSEFRDSNSDMDEIREQSDNTRNCWANGINYQQEERNNQGEIIQKGLRLPQIGALHAALSHWTTSTEPALIVMPTGTGKTEVMVASSIGGQCNRVLVIVPSDALRTQTADRFESYSILQKAGVIPEDISLPVIGILKSRPTRDHLQELQLCNIVITTMQSVAGAEPQIQEEFADLFSHIFFDEAHHSNATTWKKFQENCRGSKSLLFTATPFREDGKVIQGRMIYNYPLSKAQGEGYFEQIRFEEVFEADESQSDLTIARKAVELLREDIAAGYNHILLARTNTIDSANRLLTEIYEPHFPDLHPVVLHNKTPNRSSVVKDIRSGEHKIIVCVDMFGEGFDLPNLKIAAMHSVHKSLGITLQFIGRFTRAGEGVGQAAFVANTAEDGVPEALDSLYIEDSDWDYLIAGLSYDAIKPQEHLSEIVANLREIGGLEDDTKISPFSLRPKTSVQVFRTDRFTPQNFPNAFKKSQKVFQPQISNQDNILLLFVHERNKVEWTDSKEIQSDSWELYIAYYVPDMELLFIHASNRGRGAWTLAKAVSNNPEQIKGETVFKTFSGLQRLTLHSVGLSGRSRNVRYQMHAGLDVTNAIDPIQQQDKLKVNVTGVGYRDGERTSIGCSIKGKIWSMNAGTLAHWRDWCREVGQKLLDGQIGPNDFLSHTLIPKIIPNLPDRVALMADWPEQLFESSNFQFTATIDGIEYNFHDCELDLLNWDHANNRFWFVLLMGDAQRAEFEFRLIPGQGNGESSFNVIQQNGNPVTIRALGKEVIATDFFEENPPLIRFADGSQLSGNLILEPREELPQVFEPENILTIDWGGVDIRTESKWRNGQFRENSIQEHFMDFLAQGDSTIIFDDDDTGESADIVSISEDEREIHVYLWHCKYSHGDEPGQRVQDLYEVCGQSEKSVKWAWKLSNLIKHLIERESNHLRGRPSRFNRGSISDLSILRRSAKRKFVKFHIGIVQPGLSREGIAPEYLTIIGSANSFVKCITDNSLIVYGNE